LRSKDKGAFFGYTRKDTPEYDNIWMMPNYAYWSWNYTHAPSWNSIRREIDQSEKKTPWHKKDPRVVWRGKIKMAELRKELVRVSEGKRWSDIKPVVINNATDVHTKDVMNLRQFCGYKYTVQTEGTSYSGRLKYLQLCRSALITHPLEWQEFHTHLLKVSGPNTNYIQASENFGNLEDAMEYYRVHDDEAEEIAKNSYDTFARRYLTPAAVSLKDLQQSILVLTDLGHMLLETYVHVLGIGSRLRAATICAGQGGQYGDARHTLDCVCGELAKGPIYHSIGTDEIIFACLRSKWGGTWHGMA
jgi:protein glucosyltransferase